MTFHTQVVGANGQRQAMFIERTPGPCRGHPRQLRVRAARRADRLLRRRHDRGPGRDGPRGAAARPAGHRRHVGRAVDVERCRPGGRQPAPRRSRPRHRPVHPARRCADLDRRARHPGRSRARPSPPSPSSIPSRCGPPSSSWSAGPCHRSSLGHRSWAPIARTRLFDAAYREHSRRLARAIDRGSGRGEQAARQEVSETA